MLPKSSFPCEDPKTGVGLGSPCRGVWGQILDKEEQLEHVNFMAGYKESLDSLRLFNHPHIKPGLHYRAAKATKQPLWLWSASLAKVMPLFGSVALSSYPNHS